MNQVLSRAVVSSTTSRDQDQVSYMFSKDVLTLKYFFHQNTTCSKVDKSQMCGSVNFESRSVKPANSSRNKIWPEPPFKSFPLPLTSHTIDVFLDFQSYIHGITQYDCFGACLVTLAKSMIFLWIVVHSHCCGSAWCESTSWFVHSSVAGMGVSCLRGYYT